MYLFLFVLSLFSLLTADHIPRFEGQFREYETRRLDLIETFLPDDPVIFEAGGHYGEDSIKMATKWPEGLVLTFEPNPHAFELLQSATLSFPNIHGYNLAVNNYNGTALLNICYGTNGNNPIFEGASSLLKASPSMQIHYQGPKVEVPCVVLDDWCKENGIDHIDFLWLDLEGLELQVLKSSPEILKTVRVIHTETNFRLFREGMTLYRDLRRFLEEAGFKLVAHWYIEGLQGDAIFVRRELTHGKLPSDKL